jgi:small subunit ribosomal protein S17
MPRKKKEDEIEETGVEATAAAAEEASPAPAKRSRKAAADTADEGSIVSTVVEAATDAMVSVAETIGTVAADVVSAVTTPTGPRAKQHKRAEKVGIVSSDKMTKTVTVRVDRLVKHPVYRKYVKKRKKFMAHDDMGAKIGDKVKIVETRPMSARKRWRVVEIIQKAEL